MLIVFVGLVGFCFGFVCLLCFWCLLLQFCLVCDRLLILFVFVLHVPCFLFIVYEFLILLILCLFCGFCWYLAWAGVVLGVCVWSLSLVCLCSGVICCLFLELGFFGLSLFWVWV